VAAERLAVWKLRLAQPDPQALTFLAEDDDGEAVGFAHVVLAADPRWGALLDNLHVAVTHKRRGIGSLLIRRAGAAAGERGMGLYLWVLEQNADARAFYEKLGGECVGRAAASPPGGVASRLVGAPVRLRYVWRDPSAI
jgi:predicted N-acetyltransferase YhbS